MNNDRIKLPAQEWLGYDPEQGDIHGLKTTDTGSCCNMKHPYLDRILSVLSLIAVPIFIIVAVCLILRTYIEDIRTYFSRED